MTVRKGNTMNVVKTCNVNVRKRDSTDINNRECVAIFPGRNMAQKFIDDNPDLHLLDARIGQSVIMIIETTMDFDTIIVEID